MPVNAGTTNSDLERRLVWILGSPRSGSTWLLRLLAYPWEVEATPAGLARSRFRPGQTANIVAINESYLPQHLAPLRDPLPEPGNGPRSGPTLNDLRAGHPAYFFDADYAEEWREPLRALVLGRLGAQVHRAEGEHGLLNPPVVVKEPNGSHAADLLAKLLPASRIIFLLRDGRDVIDSMIAADSPGGWRTRQEGVATLRTSEQRLGAIRREARLWLVRTEATERACEVLGAEGSTLVRYEELLADTGAQLRRLDEWVGVGRGELTIRAAIHANRFNSLRNRIRGAGKGVRAASPGLWRENLSDAEQQLMNELLGAKLRALSYRL